MPNNCSVLHRPSTRIDAQYEIGLFLCPSVNHIVVIHELVPYTKFVDVAYAINAFGCLSHILFAQRVNTMIVWRHGKWQPFLHPLGCK